MAILENKENFLVDAEILSSRRQRTHTKTPIQSFFFFLVSHIVLGSVLYIFVSYHDIIVVSELLLFVLLAPFRFGKSLFCVCRSCVLSTDFPRAAGTGWQVLCCRCAATIVLRVSSTYALLRSMKFVNMDTVQCEQHDCHLQYSWKMWNTTTTKMLWIVIFVFFFFVFMSRHMVAIWRRSHKKRMTTWLIEELNHFVSCTICWVATTDEKGKYI